MAKNYGKTGKVFTIGGINYQTDYLDLNWLMYSLIYFLGIPEGKALPNTILLATCSQHWSKRID